MAALPQKKTPDCFAKGVFVLWIVFLVWTAVGAFIIPLGINAHNLEEHIANPDLRALGKAILPFADAVWMTLAGVCTYFLIFQAEGLDRARRISGLVVLGAGAIEFMGAVTGFPFGPYIYTSVLGLKLLGVLPYTIPLAWLVILAGGRHLLLWGIPGWTWNRWSHAAFIALIALLTDINMEQVAWKVREYWSWYPQGMETDFPQWPPLQNFVAWYLVAFALAACFPAPRGGFLHRTATWRLALMPVLINALFLLTHLTGALGWRR